MHTHPPVLTVPEPCLAAGDAPFETKYLLTPDLAEATAAWARTRLARDPHACGPGGLYGVASLYFDSPLLEIYHRAHANGVAKYRIRRYGTEERLFLECKSKLSGRVFKRRTPVASSELAELCRPNAGSAWAGAWFAAAIGRRALRPVCHVSYVRQAWVGELDGQRVRMTLDRELRSTATSCLELPVRVLMGSRLFSGCVLEIKYACSLPTGLEQWLRELGCQAQPLSKYRQAVDVCGIAQAKESSVCRDHAVGAGRASGLSRIP